MKKKKLYSKWAKVLVVLVLAASAAVAGISGGWMLVGYNQGMDLREVMNPVSYEKSSAASAYLETEGHKILTSIGNRNRFCADGYTYDENATVDIMDMDAGIGKADKNPDTEYTLKALDDFYNSREQAILQYLTYQTEEFIYYDEEEGVYHETVESGTWTDSGDTVAVPEDSVNKTEIYGSEAKVLGVVSADTTMLVDDYSSGEQWEKPVEFEVKCYDSEYNVLYNNGIEAEKTGILNVSGGTLADYAQDHLDSVSLRLCYERLLQAAEQLHEYLAITEEETNARFYVRDTETGMVYTNVDAWRELSFREVENAYEAMCEDADKQVYYMVDASGKNKEFICVPAMNEYESGMRETGDNLLEQAQEILGKSASQMFIGLDTNYPLHESQSYTNVVFYEWYVKNQPFGQINKMYILAAAAVLMIIMLILLSCQTGHRASDTEIHAVPMDRFPIEFMVIMDIVLWVLIVCLFAELPYFYYGSTDITYLREVCLTRCVGASAAMVLAALLTAWELKRYGRRIKEHSLGGSILRSIARGIRKAAKAFYDARKENQKLMLIFIGFTAIHFIFLLIAGVLFARWAGGFGFLIVLCLIIFDIYVLLRLLKNTRGRDEIKKGMSEIAKGNLDYRINTENMSGDNLDMAYELNCVQVGLKQAVEAEMKSERLKTDLITNVSHDIKTPLTSIINYVDILKREDIQDEKVAGYINILDRKSQRLKQLTEDLVEASKISSGNITLDMQDINLKQLIKQTNGEFEEKFAIKNLELICSLPESEMLIRADGRRMFRVIENLYNNAAKYAMPNSRVYVNGELKGGKVIFSMKNMSESPLNFKAEELIERFVRGDVSRSTEGSGLGLEIARNLTIMQNGTFDLYLDGDLFKVTITFDAI